MDLLDTGWYHDTRSVHPRFIYITWPQAAPLKWTISYNLEKGLLLLASGCLKNSSLVSQQDLDR